MSVARFRFSLCVLLAAFAASGCCQRKGYILRGDFALELNRVNHLFGRYDDYEISPDDCDCAECDLAGYDDAGGGGLHAPEPRLHPVPTRPVFEPQRAAPQYEESAPPAQATPKNSQSFRYRNGTGPRLASADDGMNPPRNPNTGTRRRPLESFEPKKKTPTTKAR